MAKIAGIGCAAIFGLLLCGGLLVAVLFIVAYNDMVKAEINLSTSWENEQNYLSGYVLGFQEQAGVMNFNASLISDTMVDAILAQPGDEDFGQDALVAVISQAYPDMGVGEMTELAQNLMRYVESERANFRDLHTRTMDEAKEYETTITTFPGNFIAGFLGFPSGNLQARVNGQVIASGRDALTIIRRPISDAITNEAFEDGTMNPLSPFPATEAPR